MVDVVAGDGVGCVRAVLGERCVTMLAPSLDRDVCLEHRLPAIMPTAPRGDAHDPHDMAAWYQALRFAGVTRSRTLDDRRMHRLAAYGIFSAFVAMHGPTIAAKIEAGRTPNAVGIRALMRRAGSHTLD